VVRVETQVSGKAGIRGHHHHHQEEAMWEQAMQEEMQEDIMKEESAEEVVHLLLHQEDPLGVVIHLHLHLLLHHRSHPAVQTVRMVQTHLVLVHRRREVIPLTQNVRFVGYVEN
jgi:hypothetical protein